MNQILLSSRTIFYWIVLSIFETLSYNIICELQVIYYQVK